LEGHRREPARGSWDFAQWAGSCQTQITRKDRASRGLDVSVCAQGEGSSVWGDLE